MWYFLFFVQTQLLSLPHSLCVNAIAICFCHGLFLSMSWSATVQHFGLYLSVDWVDA